MEDQVGGPRDLKGLIAVGGENEAEKRRSGKAQKGTDCSVGVLTNMIRTGKKERGKC